jgi:hypothetical protein
MGSASRAPGGIIMNNVSSILNIVAAFASVSAVVTSSYLAVQALRYNRNANHMPVIIELFREHRSEAFVRKEQFLWRAMPLQDPSKGFSRLPRKTRAYATDVALFYLMIGYLSEYQISDPELLALQVQYRLLKTWEAIEPYVRKERILRGGEFTFLNTLEVFVERVRKLDSDAIARRMSDKLKS